MTDPVHLEAHLRLHPDDWPSWLVYADWLTDQGDSRGEIITLSHQLETGTESAGARERIQALETEGEPRWREGLPDMVFSWRFGFVIRVAVRWKQETQQLAQLAAHPTCRFLTGLQSQDAYYDHNEFLKDLAVWTSSLPLRSLAVRVRLPDLVGVLAEHPALSGLRELSLVGAAVAPQGVLALARSSVLGELVSLDLGGCQIGGEAATALISSEALRSLTRLELRGADRYGDNLANALVRTPRGRVRHLGLASNNIGSFEARALADAECLQGLVSLELQHNPLGPRGASALLRSEHLRGLQSLDLTRTKLGGSGISALAHAEGLSDLRELRLAFDDLGVDDARMLASSETLRALTLLDLRNNHIASTGTAALASWQGVSRLRRLDLSSNRLKDKGVHALAASPHLGELRYLDLSGNAISPEAAQALTTLRSLCELRLP